jgi:hypothetical protein
LLPSLSVVVEARERAEPPMAEAGYVILVTTAPRGTIPADLWRKSHVVHL